MTRLLLFLAVMLLYLPGAAQTLSFVYPTQDHTFAIEDSFSGYASLASKSKWLPEQGRALPPEEVLHQLKDQFVDLDTNIKSTGWIKVAVFNSTYEPRHLVLSFGMVNLADVWILHENGGSEEQVGGLTKQGLWPEGWHDGSAIMQLDIPERHTVLLLARIVPDLSQTPTLRVSVEDRMVWEEARNNSRHWLQAGGIAFMLGAAIALPAWLLKRESMHAWFLALLALSQGFVSVQYGLWSHLFWSGTPQIDQALMHLLIWGMPFVFWLYLKSTLTANVKLALFWAGLRAAICASLWAFNQLEYLHWLEVPSYLIDAVLFMYILSQTKSLSTRKKYWAVGNFCFWLSALFSWVWMEWWYDGFYRPDLQVWEINTWIALLAYLYMSLPQQKPANV